MVDDSGNKQISVLKRLRIDDLDKMVTNLADNYRVYVPVDNDGVIEFKLFKPGTAIAWEYQNSTKPPKDVIFPQTQEMFRYDIKKDQGVVIKSEKNEEKPVVIVGLRPCDAHALTKVDCNFEGEFIDPYYFNNRNNTKLIGLGCTDPCFNCFCSSMGGSPHSYKGLDALIVKLTDANIIEAVTETGVNLFKEISVTDEKVSQDIIDRISEQKQKSGEKITRVVEPPVIDELDMEFFNDKIWEEIGERCISCGICVFVCPTCRCFDIQDEATSRHGRRIRVWDTCQFPEYTVHASDYNPRPARTNRVRNRVLCRLKYTVDKFGVNYCTGCGRCITHCPVNIDIVESFAMAKSVIQKRSGAGASENGVVAAGTEEVKN